MLKSETNFLDKVAKFVWPIKWHENKKFIPMALMMACVLFNYSTLRSVKDSLVNTNIGPEALSFIKTYLVLPSAMIFMIIYAKLCNVMSQQKVFYTLTTFFIAYFTLFTFVLYPNPEYFQISKNTIEALAINYPNFKWFIRIIGCWSYASFYVMSELWGSVMVTLLFWQFANKITKTEEAKRFYSMFGLIGNFGLILAAIAFGIFFDENMQIVPKNVKSIPVLCLVIFNGVLILFLYRWINLHVLTDPNLYNPNEIGVKKKSKVKLSLGDSFKMIVTSKYLGLIALLVFSYGVSINLVEGVWKAQVTKLCPTEDEYNLFMGQFLGYQGAVAIFFMLVGSNILRRVSWFTAAMFTPLMILITGTAFFSFIIFDSGLGLQLAAFFGTGPLVVVVIIGMGQNVLSKAVKYSLFDSTKEMAYIPLDDEMKTKGKAAVDVIGGRFGKSAGGFIQSTFFMLMPSLGFTEATPYFGAIFFVIVILWVFAVKALGHEYQNKLIENEAAKNSEF